MSSAAINAPHTRAATAPLDQKASGLIGALTPRVPEPEWTRLEHMRPLQERASATSVREELSPWTSLRIQAVLDVIKQPAPMVVTVLFTGETTGKELVARFVHHLGSRHDGLRQGEPCGLQDQGGRARPQSARH